MTSLIDACVLVLKRSWRYMVQTFTECSGVSQVSLKSFCQLSTWCLVQVWSISIWSNACNWLDRTELLTGLAARRLRVDSVANLSVCPIKLTNLIRSGRASHWLSN